MAERARTKDEQALEALLKAWGREYGADYRDEPRRWLRTLTHPIAQSMEFAPGKKVTRITQILGRDGGDRRRIMGAAAGRLTLKGKPIPIPMGFVDPVPCKARARGKGGGHGFRPVPPALQKVEQAVLRLETFSMLRALCVRVQYADEGKQEDKFARVNEEMRKVKGENARRDIREISLHTYRDELTYARFYLGVELLELVKAA